MLSRDYIGLIKTRTIFSCKGYNSGITIHFFHELCFLCCDVLSKLLSLMVHNLQLLLKFRNFILQEILKNENTEHMNIYIG
jgi:hypothetical protein